MSPRKPSAAQVRRRTKERSEEANRRTPLPKEYAHWLNHGYEPRGLHTGAWAMLRPFVLETLERSSIRGLASLRNRTSDIVHFGGWCLQRDLDLDPTTVMRRELVDEYTRVGMAGSSTKSRADRRARLRSVADHINPTPETQRRESLPRQALRPPYTGAEMTAVRRAAFVQSTPEKARQLCLCVGLGAGAGIDSHDLKHLTSKDVTDTERGIRVDVPGDRARTVWVLAAYEPLVRRGLEDVGGRPYLLGQNPSRANVAGQVFQRADWFGDLPHLEQSRLRVTWLATHLMLNTPLAVLCEAAGLTSSRTLFDLLPMLPTGATHDNATILRGGEQR